MTAPEGKKAFGGYTIDFKGCEESMEELFGSAPLNPGQMLQRLWKFIRDNGLFKKDEGK